MSILLILLLLLLFGGGITAPTYGYSRGWGWGPFGGIVGLLLLLLVLHLLGVF